MMCIILLRSKTHNRILRLSIRSHCFHIQPEISLFRFPCYPVTSGPICYQTPFLLIQIIRLPFKFHIGCITVIGYTYINALIPHDITHPIQIKIIAGIIMCCCIGNCLRRTISIAVNCCYLYPVITSFWLPFHFRFCGPF